MLTLFRDLTFIAVATSLSIGGVAAVAAMAPVGAFAAAASVTWTCLIAVGVVRALRVAHRHEPDPPGAFLMPW